VALFLLPVQATSDHPAPNAGFLVVSKRPRAYVEKCPYVRGLQQVIGSTAAGRTPWRSASADQSMTFMAHMMVVALEARDTAEDSARGRHGLGRSAGGGMSSLTVTCLAR